ncbi:hypothetical protein OY671_009092, partial [Metschnikowia pulcherrima]
FRVGAVVSSIGGTMFSSWSGEQITSRGIGNGVSSIIMAGIVAQMPKFISNSFEGGRTGSISPFVIAGVTVMILALVVMICFMDRSTRRSSIQYPKRATQRGMMNADRSHSPLKINTAGVIPPIFASSSSSSPSTITQFAGNASKPDSVMGKVVIASNQYSGHGKPSYMSLYASGIIFFSFFYTAVVFNPEETADNSKRNGGFIPGIRPGKNTANYLDYVSTRITVSGA